MNECKLYQLKLRSFVVMAIASMAVCSGLQAHAQVASWAAPINGFYDDAANWDPVGVPEATDAVVVAQSGDYVIGIPGAHGAASLTVANNADVDFTVAGASSSPRLLRLTGNASIDEAKLRLLGNTAGPRLSVVLDGDVDLFGATDALQIVDNVALLNSSTTINVDGSIPVRGTLARWSMSDELTVGGGAQLDIAAGATVAVRNNVVVGPNASSGVIQITGVGEDGAPSMLEANSRLLPGFFGTGQLFVRDGGRIDVAGFLQAATGAGSFASTVVGSDSPAGHLSELNTGPIILGAGGTADLTIESGGRVNSSSATIGNSSQGLVELVGGDLGAKWNIAGDLLMSQGAYGQLLVRSGAVLESYRAFLGLGSASSGPAVFVLTGTRDAPTTVWENPGDVYIAGDESETGSPASLRIDGNATANIGGTITLWQEADLRLADGGALAADILDHTRGGVFNFEGGVLSVNRFEGDLSNLGGSLAPGTDEAAGATIVTGDYNQHADAKLTIGIGGTSPGGTHDLGNVLGDGNLDGLLELSLLEGFTPDAAEVFTVLAADTLTGFFDNVNSGQRLETTEGRGSFVVNYGIGSAFNELRIVLSDFLPSATIPGDYNADRDVDGSDFLAWQRSDGTPDGLAAWQTNYGAQAPPLAATKAVPEPTSAVLGLVAALAIAFQRQ